MMYLKMNSSVQRRASRYRLVAFAVLLTGSMLSGVALGYPAIPPVTTSSLADIPTGSFVSARDGGASFLFKNEIVYTFGDTILSKANSTGSFWAVNTMFHTTTTLIEKGYGAGYNYKDTGQAPEQWLPWTQNEIAYNESGKGLVGLWPTSSFRDPNTGKQYLWFGKVLEHPGGFFDGVGSGFVEVTSLKTPPTRLRHRPGEAEDYLMFLTTTDNFGGFGDISVMSGNYLYVYRYNNWGLLHIARVPLDREAFKSRAAYTFWDGKSWVPEISAAAVILTGATAGTIQWNAYLKCWLYTHMEWVGHRMLMQVADNPWGPWSEPKAIYEAEVGVNGGQPYFAQAHKEMEQENGRVQYTSYAAAGDATGSGIRMIRVRFGDRPTAVRGGWEAYDTDLPGK